MRPAASRHPTRPPRGRRSLDRARLAAGLCCSCALFVFACEPAPAEDPAPDRPSVAAPDLRHGSASPDVHPPASRSLADADAAARLPDGVACAAPPEGHDAWEIIAEPCVATRPMPDALVEHLDAHPDTVHLDSTWGVPAFAWLPRAPGARTAAPPGTTTAGAPETAPSIDPFDLGGAIGVDDGARPTTPDPSDPSPDVVPRRAEPLPRSEVETAARAALTARAALWRLTDEVRAELHVAHVHDTGRGAIVVRMQRVIEGVPLYGQRIAVVLDRTLAPVAISGHVSGHPTTGLAAARLDAAAALTAALASVGTSMSSRDLHAIDAQDGFLRYAASSGAGDGARLRAPARLQRVVYPMPDALLPAWYVELELELPGSARGFVGLGLVVDARDGRLLARRDLVRDATSAWAHVDEEGRPWPSPYHGQHLSDDDDAGPRDQSPVQVSLHGRHPLGDAWLLPGVTETRGNHVDAYSDATGDNGLDARDRRASLVDGASRAWDPGLAPLANDAAHDAPLVQMFYTVNTLHDLFYAHGFDEAAGNAQLDNHGRGGAAGDPLLAESADHSGIDNANIYVPTDGASPRMQMYVYERGTWAVVDGASGSWSAARADVPAQFDASAPVVAVEGDGCALAADAVRGRVALIDRGGCALPEVARRAEAAGAAAVIVVDAGLERPVDHVAVLTGFDGGLRTPLVVVGPAAGQALRAQQGHPVVLRALPAQDGALDTELVTHEWAHYLFARLAGGAPDTAQTRALDEGNSDFVALLTGARRGDASLDGGARPLVTWAGRRHRFGMRRAPYATDRAINPLTLGHIAADATLPTTAPLSALARTLPPESPHAAGEVWAVSMWEVANALIDEHGFDDGRERMLDALVAALASMPLRATWVEARDAVLAALYAGDPRDFELGWAAFARRGLGADARAPERFSDDLVGVVESFEEGGRLSIGAVRVDDRARGCDDDGVLDRGESALLSATVTNTGSVALTDVAVRFELEATDDTALSVDFPDGAVAIVDALGPMESVAVSVEVALRDAAPLTPAALSATADAEVLSRPTQTTRTLYVSADIVEGSARCEGFESQLSGWTTELVGAEPGEHVGWRMVVDANGVRGWRAPAPAMRTDARLVSPPMEVSTEVPFVVEIEHAYDLETGPGGHAFDGAVLELTTDGGRTWLDAASAGAQQPPYGVMIVDLAAVSGAELAKTNPLAGRAAFGGQNASHPGTDRARFDFGTALAGERVQLRLRLATDAEIGRGGWTVAQIGVRGVDNRPFASWVADDAVCSGQGASVPATQVATLGAVCGGEAVELPVAAASWRQVGGVPVSLAGDGFAAPRVEHDTVLRFASTNEAGLATELAVLVHGWHGAEERMASGLDLPAADDAAGGCGCSVRAGTGRGPGTPWRWMALVAGFVLLTRRRRARR